MQRKLATILVGDFVGSTAAMDADEEGALVRIAASLDAIGRIVERYEGRVFNTAGDAVLAEFASPVNAVRAAMNSRDELTVLPGSDLRDMRFGLHLADIVVVGDDLRGDGVNLAARIQSAAEPGHIEVSGALYDHVRRASPCAFEHIGQRTFKGISEPIDIYRVGKSIDRHRFQSAPTRQATTPAAAKPNSVAVAPFKVSSKADEDQTFLAEGLTDDLTLELSRLKKIFVSSRSASAALTTDDPSEIGSALGVRYVVSGTVRKLGSRVRLNVSLTETEHGQVVWSERIQRPFDEILDVLDELTVHIAATISGRMEHAEFASVRLKRPEDMSAYEHYLRGLDQHRLAGLSDQHAREAMHWFKKAIDADETFGRPYAMYVCAWSFLPEFETNVAEAQLSRALQLDPTDPEAHRIMGAIKMKTGDFAGSRHHHERAIEMAPNDAYVLGRCAAFYLFAGEPERALELLDRAEALDPFLPVWIMEERVAAYYCLEQYENVFDIAALLPFQTRRTLIYQAAASVACDEVEKARHLMAKALTLDDTLSTFYIANQDSFRDPDVSQTLIDRAVAAGLPVEPIRENETA